MKCADLRANNRCGGRSRSIPRKYWWALSLVLLTLLYCDPSWALQRHDLDTGQPEAPPVATQAGADSHSAEPASGQAGATGSQPSQTAPALQQGHGVGADVQKPPSLLPAGEGGHGVGGPTTEGLPEHEEKAMAHEEHGVVLPHISPIPGVTFVQTMIDLMEHELSGRTFGWRPNDIFIGRFTDNINNFQLGVLEAMRHTSLRLKDSLTRMGDADAYDPDLEAALNLFMNRATLFWFPSAENSYREAIDHLKSFLVKLETGKRHFYYRSDNLLLLLATYRDLLGNVNRNLIRSDVGFFDSDDYFYYAKGVAHVYFEILKVVRVGYESQIATTLDAVAMMDEVLHELHRAEEMDPWIVFNADEDSFFANHRYNLNAPLSEVAHLLVVMSRL